MTSPRPEFQLYTVSYKTHTAGYLSVLLDKVQLVRVCSIELPWLDNLNGVSCIPADTYPIVLEHSDRFGTELWEIKDVPGRSECKIHTVNFVQDLAGCVGVGESFKDINADGTFDLVKSRAALKRVHDAMADTRETIIKITSGNAKRMLAPGMNGFA